MRKLLSLSVVFMMLIAMTSCEGTEPTKTPVGDTTVDTTNVAPSEKPVVKSLITCKMRKGENTTLDGEPAYLAEIVFTSSQALIADINLDNEEGMGIVWEKGDEYDGPVFDWPEIEKDEQLYPEGLEWKTWPPVLPKGATEYVMQIACKISVADKNPDGTIPLRIDNQDYSEYKITGAVFMLTDMYKK